MGNRYLTCRYCIYCNDSLSDTMCRLHKKTINPGVACCEDIVYTPKGLARIGKKERNKQEQKYTPLKTKTKIKKKNSTRKKG